MRVFSRDEQFADEARHYPAGTLVRIELPGDAHHGQAGEVAYAETPRTRIVDFGGDVRRHYCIAALRPRTEP